MNYLSDFRCVNKLIPLLSSACLERELQCRLACQCCEIASHQGLLRTAMVTTCGRIGQQQLWPLLRSVFSLFSRLLGVDGVVDTCLLACLVNTFCINSMLYLWILLRHCDCRESGCYCCCCCCYYCACCFVTFLKHFRLSEGLWLIDWSKPLGKARREKGLAACHKRRK